MCFRKYTGERTGPRHREQRHDNLATMEALARPQSADSRSSCLKFKSFRFNRSDRSLSQATRINMQPAALQSFRWTMIVGLLNVLMALWAQAVPQQPLFRDFTLDGLPTAPDISACPPLPERVSPPTDINDLRIDDFRVIAALGDSISAAFGAAGIARDPKDIENTYENRGRSFSMGGDPGAKTLANMVKHFRGSRGLIGPSRGWCRVPTFG